MNEREGGIVRSAISGAKEAMAGAVGAIAALWAGHITPFRLLYWSVVVATFRHSAIGFATLEDDNVWLGALAATAVDVGMMLAAEKLRDAQQARTWLVSGLALAAVGSVYSQLLYSVTHAAAVPIADGATWLGEYATYIINARVIALPVLLPLLAVVYSFASRAPDPQPVAHDDRQGAIVTQPETKTERARAILAAVPQASNAAVAEIVGCSESLVRGARNGNGTG